MRFHDTHTDSKLSVRLRALCVPDVCKTQKGERNAGTTDVYYVCILLFGITFLHTHRHIEPCRAVVLLFLFC